MKLLAFVFILPLLLAVSAGNTCQNLSTVIPYCNHVLTDLNKKLGESCTEDSDCETAYTACMKGKCKCIDGFNEGNDGQCRSESK